MKKADAIFCADLHIRPDRPVCRMDEDYTEEQFRKLRFIIDLQAKHDCPLFVAGDFGDAAGERCWKPWLLSRVITEIGVRRHEQCNKSNRVEFGIHVIPGQHDLPEHRLDAVEKSGLFVIDSAECIISQPKLRSDYWVVPNRDKTKGDCFVVTFMPWGGDDPAFPVLVKTDRLVIRDVLLGHRMTVYDNPIYPGQKDPTALQFLKSHPQYDLIVLGDNHQSFMVEHAGRKLISPGSMMRMTADQFDHEPSVYLWWAETNDVERVKIPVRPAAEVITREHIDRTQARDMRMEAFVESLKKTYEVGLSFRENLKQHFASNRTRKAIESKVWECL